MTQDKPGFRRTATVTPRSNAGEEVTAGRGPFTQAQITHLMKAEFARARRHEYPLSCVLIQVDRLQKLTEVHGAELRMIVKRELGRVVDEKTRGHDHLGAMSDGTYLLLLPHTEASNAQIVAERIRTAFSAQELEVGGTLMPLTISLGVASCEDRDTMFFDTMVSQAEVALEWAARDGGDCSVVFRREKFVGPQ